MQKLTFSVLNNAGHSISGAGISLEPGLNEKVSVAAFTKAFLGPDGQPTPSAAKHLNPRGDKPPSVIPVTVRAVAKLPQEYALLAVACAQPEDGRTLQALLEMEDRKPVADAIRARLSALAAPRRQPRAQSQEPNTSPAPTPSSAGTHSGREAIARDGGQLSVVGVPADIEPVATTEEAQPMLEPISHEPDPTQPKGMFFTGSGESMAGVRDLGGGPRSFQGGSGISATGTESPASEIQQALSAYDATGAAAGSHPGGQLQPAAPAPSPMADASPESPATSAPGAPAPRESPFAQPPSRRGRRGQG